MVCVFSTYHTHCQVAWLQRLMYIIRDFEFGSSLGNYYHLVLGDTSVIWVVNHNVIPKNLVKMDNFCIFVSQLLLMPPQIHPARPHQIQNLFNFFCCENNEKSEFCKEKLNIFGILDSLTPIHSFKLRQNCSYYPVSVMCKQRCHSQMYNIKPFEIRKSKQKHEKSTLTLTE